MHPGAFRFDLHVPTPLQETVSMGTSGGGRDEHESSGARPRPCVLGRPPLSLSPVSQTRCSEALASALTDLGAEPKMKPCQSKRSTRTWQRWRSPSRPRCVNYVRPFLESFPKLNSASHMACRPSACEAR